MDETTDEYESVRVVYRPVVDNPENGPKQYGDEQSITVTGWYFTTDSSDNPVKLCGTTNDGKDVIAPTAYADGSTLRVRDSEYQYELFDSVGCVERIEGVQS